MTRYDSVSRPIIGSQIVASPHPGCSRTSGRPSVPLSCAQTSPPGTGMVSSTAGIVAQSAPPAGARRLPCGRGILGRGRRGGHFMSSPVSSCRLLILVEQGLECPVPGGVVGGAVLPAVPDHEQPGAGEDADGVGVVVAAGAGAVVEVGGPGAGAAGVAGEVGDGVAEVLVAG